MSSDVRVKREYAEEMLNTYNRLHLIGCIERG